VCSLKKSFSLLKKIGAIFLCASTLFSVSCSSTPKEIHGADLLKLSDNALYEKVYMQTLDLVEQYPNDEIAFSKITPEHRTVYILSIFDMEIQNGGLCQFFVNSSRLLAPHVDQCLMTVNAEEQRKLFSSFVTTNNIDLNNLESFEIEDATEFVAQTERYDFESFDNAYIELTPLQDYLISYIKANISVF
jgi:hypothetical protein